jgi:hypothetical protein
MSNIFISKSQFIKGLQCLKSLYLHKHQPKLAGEVSESRKAQFESGKEVGAVARELYPGGVEIIFDENNFAEQLKLTKAHIDRGVTIIYEPAFDHEGLFTKSDILRKGKQGWNLYEVKKSTKIKKDAFHYEDVAFQFYILRENGLSVNKTYLVHINNQYERQGDIEVEKLFTLNDVTKDVKDLQKKIIEQVNIQKKMLSGRTPKIEIGEYCSVPYECEFMGHCWEHIPDDSVLDLKGRGAKRFELYRKGIIHLKDVPLKGLPLPVQLQVDCALKKKCFINKASIKDFLDSLWYPLYFLDFETFDSPIPLYDGTKPYQKFPFQYSIHYLEKEGSKLKHNEYLAEPNIDPRKEIAKRLIEQIPKNACVLVYNMSFEKSVLNNLKAWFPKYEKEIEGIINNLHDLMLPFKNKLYYSWQMKGSYSIKTVLPVLVPELSYDGLEVSEGDMAMLAYKRMCESTDPSEIEGIRKSLLEYCRLDSLGMVKIVERLKEMVYAKSA